MFAGSPGTSETTISFAIPSNNPVGIASGDVMQINFATVPPNTPSTSFGVTLVNVFDAGGNVIQ